jgi:hypothetical protein
LFPLLSWGNLFWGPCFAPEPLLLAILLEKFEFWEQLEVSVSAGLLHKSKRDRKTNVVSVFKISNDHVIFKHKCLPEVRISEVFETVHKYLPYC